MDTGDRLQDERGSREWNWSPKFSPTLVNQVTDILSGYRDGAMGKIRHMGRSRGDQAGTAGKRH